MKLYERLPTRVSVQGKPYRIRPWFNRILEAIDIISRDDWTDGMKTAYIKKLLIRGRCRDPLGVINAVVDQWINIQGGDKSGDETLDFTQDADFIYAAFLQAYGLDLYKLRDKLHWLSFTALLSALPQDTKLSEIIDIRTRDIPERTKYNRKEVETLTRLKAKWRVRTTKKRAEEKYQDALRNVAQKLIEMARR